MSIWMQRNNVATTCTASMHVTIIAPLREALDAFRGARELPPVPNQGAFPAFRFTHASAEVTLLRGGVGKASAAMVAQHAVDRFAPDYLLMTASAAASATAWRWTMSW